MNKSHRLLLIVLLSTFTAFSQTKDYTIQLTSGSILYPPNINQQTIDSFNNVSRPDSRSLILIQFSAIPGAETAKLLSGSGITLLDYIPNFTYTASVDGNLQLAALQGSGVRSIIPLTAKQKLHPYLANNQFPSWAVSIPGTIDVLISFVRTDSYGYVVSELQKANVDILSTKLANYRILKLRIAANRLTELASLPFIEYVQPAPSAAQPLNFNSRAASGANVLKSTLANGGKGLDGSGVVVGVGDNSDVQTHLDFSNRLINRSIDPSKGHGHHVTGTVAGAGNINSIYQGYAPKATIISTSDDMLIYNTDSYVKDFGMVLSNNSYGNVVGDCNYAGFYDLLSRVVDQQAIDYPNLGIVFASGNDGGNSCFSLPLGYRTVVGGYQAAKNVLTVGATTFDGTVAFFSSRGPVKDGRVKPEITAMGEFVASAWPTNYYSYNNGTSMAAPAVTGGLALLYQRYKQLNGNANPKNGLMKALICASATDRGNDGPDYSYGFGWMNLVRSVDVLEKNRFITSTIANNGSNSHTITVPAGTAHLKVVLYWNDPAAAVLSSKTLVNDLDLEVSNGTNTVLPRILDANNVTATAVTGKDHLNNMEEVVIDNPAAGNYTITVKGTAIAKNPSQEYFIAYDIVPVSLNVVSPAGGETWVPSTNWLDSALIHWDAFGNTSSSYTIDYSLDNGSSWTNIVSNLAPSIRHYRWFIPDISSDKALVRVTQNGTGAVSISQPFAIMKVPAISLAPVQCEGYISVNWTTVTSATDYEVMILNNGEMVSAGTTTGTSYTIGGLSKDSLYAVSVRARINGTGGKRAFAVLRTPSDGNCSGTISDNDLKLDAVESPLTGRKFTSSELSSATPIKVRIKNLDDAPISNFTVSYSLNGGAWKTETDGATINANATYVHTFSSTEDLSAVGTYIIKTAVSYGADNIHANDTLTTIIKQLDNQPISVATRFIENFESAPVLELKGAQTGLNGLDRFDFTSSTAYGRVRSFINSGIAYSGSKALTLDADRYLYPSSSISYLYGTFNLSNYNVATSDIRLDFQYNSHNQTNDPNNSVWIRGSENDPWINAYDLSANQLPAGSYKRSASIELGHLLAAAGQNFTTSFQVRWGQFGYFAAADKENAGGYTFDDIRIYQVANDVQPTLIDLPALSCGFTSTTPLKVTVRNSSTNNLSGITVKYRIDGSAWATEQISSINALTNFVYTFNATANLSAPGKHTIEVVAEHPNDNFKENDTLRSVITNLPVISSYPYLEDFEHNDGYWYPGGINSTWEYGTPQSVIINKAASGAKAWKTKLIGYYNNNEHSYLYSPCFDLSSMSKPTLSFSVALDLEDCGTSLCDGAWVEYTTDGVTWTKLGNVNQGTNWYNKSTDNVWSVEGYTRYHVATIPLLMTNNTRVRFRFAFASDPAVNHEGIAIDDIHIYDNTSGIYDGVTMSAPVAQTVSGSNWVDFKSNNKLVASIKSNQNLSTTNVQAFIYPSTTTNGIRNNNSQYYHDRNLTINTANALTDSISVRFYYLDSETDSLIFAKGCTGCAKPSDAYELGVAKYSDPVKSREDGSISNDTVGTWKFIPSQNVTKVPFDKGYYAEFKVRELSELWLAMQNISRGQVQLIDFTAQKQANNDVLLQWSTALEKNMDRFEIEVARSNSDYQNNNFIKLGSVNAKNLLTTQQYSFTDNESGKSGTRYYRLKMTDIDGRITYSDIRPVVFTEFINWQVIPNPSSGLFYLQCQIGDGDPIHILITDATGRMVQSNVFSGTGQPQKIAIDLTGKAAGVYLLQVNHKGENRTIKLYKQ